MAIPTSGFSTASWTNPSSAITDFTGIIDLSLMDADFKANWNTSEQGRGRASKDDGVTELACDWIDLDHTAKTGILRVKWSGTLASSGTQVIRIYPPNTANTAYGVSDTYGQYNAYSSDWVGYWPLASDANDRTSNQHNGTGSGGIGFGGTSVYGWPATVFDGIDDVVTVPDDDLLSFGNGTTDSPFSILALTYDSARSGLLGILSKATSFNSGEYYMASNSGNLLARIVDDSESSFIGRQSSSTYTDADHLFAITYNASGDQSGVLLYIDGTSVATGGSGSGTYTAMENTANDVYIGSRGASNFFNGNVAGVILYSGELAGPWIDEESTQLEDNATFWGTWTWNSAGGGFTLTADAGTFTTTGQDSSLLFDRKVSAESGTFSTTGQNAGLFTARVLTADGGSYATVGQDANLTLGTNIILSAEAGTFSVTGQDASLIHNKIINGETGVFTLSGQPASLIWSGEDFFIQILTIGSEVQTEYNISSEIESISIFTSSIQSTIQLEGKI